MMLLSHGLLLLCLVAVVHLQTFQELTTNYCEVLAGLPENLSCAGDQARDDGGSVCLARSNLCDSTTNCAIGEDEGNPIALNNLMCNIIGKNIVVILSTITLFYRSALISVQLWE